MSADLASVREYYGKTLTSNSDLKTSACCVAEAPPLHIREVLNEIHDEVTSKFYGCGSPLPEELVGRTVLDLGCGTGRDCFVLSKLVGANGRVIGVDMTEEQLAVARKHIDYHSNKFGFEKSNVELHCGYIEDLKALGVEDSSVDAIVSNCVINLSPDKRRVFSEAFRVLKPGGELHFSDVFSDRRIPESLRDDPILLGECLSGALYVEDFRRMLGELECADVRILTSRPLDIEDPEVARKIGFVGFSSITVRCFKLPLEDRCEDYGHVATYRGSIDTSPHVFVLDDAHVFERGRPTRVCGNTARMLSETRLDKHFSVVGDFSTHFGIFDDCGPVPDTSTQPQPSASTSCC